MPRVVRRYLPAMHTLDNTNVFALALDAHDVPWLATLGGLRRHDAARDTFVAVSGATPGAIDALAFDGDGTLWVHHWLGALQALRVDGDRVVTLQAIETRDGWPAMKAASMAIAADGTLWVTSLHGLWHVDPRTHAIRKFDTHEGLPSQEFLDGALVRASDGTLFVPFHDPRKPNAMLAPAPRPPL